MPSILVHRTNCRWSSIRYIGNVLQKNGQDVYSPTNDVKKYAWNSHSTQYLVTLLTDDIIASPSLFSVGNSVQQAVNKLSATRHWHLPTALAAKLMRSVVSVHPSVGFHSSFRTNWLLTLIFNFCVRMGHDRSSPGDRSQGHRSRSKVDANACAMLIAWWP